LVALVALAALLGLVALAALVALVALGLLPFGALLAGLGFADFLVFGTGRFFVAIGPAA
jgi:hypothetical protein